MGAEDGIECAALLDSLARNHGLVAGNKRVALAAVLAFYGLDGLRLSATNDQACDLVIAVAGGNLDDVATITAVLEPAARPGTERRACCRDFAHRRG